MTNTAIRTIPVDGGEELRLEPYCEGTPRLFWALYRNGGRVRWLDRFEESFVEAAYMAGQQQAIEAAAAAANAESEGEA